MKTVRTKISLTRKIAGVFIGLMAVALSIYIWYQGGIMTVSEGFRVENVTIYNTIYMLAAGDNVKQGFTPRDTLLTGIDVMLVNTSEESTGDIVVQILDMWGDPIDEGRLSLSEITAGIYTTVPLSARLDPAVSEEFQVCVFSEGADTAPGVLLVSGEEDIEDNTELCFYNEERVWDNGLVLGYNYGERKFVGYKYQERDIIWATVFSIIVTLILGVILIFALLHLRKEKITKVIFDLAAFKQIAVVSSFFGIFFLGAVINNARIQITETPVWAYGMLFVPLAFFLWSIFLYLEGIKKGIYRGKKRIKVDSGVFVIAGVCLFTRLPMLTGLQRWDAGVYYAQIYTAASHFDFTAGSVWNYFKMANHPTFAYMFFSLMGEFLFPGKVTGVLLVLIFMSAAALICIYFMLRRYWCSMTARPALLFTLLLSVTPLFWGTFSFVNIDYMLILFFIFLVYADYRKQKILMAFWTVALLLNKETGWMIVAGFYLAYLIKLWKGTRARTIKRKLKTVFSDGIVKIMAAGILAVSVYIILQGGLGWFGQASSSSLFASAEDIAQKGRSVQAFGFYPAYIFYKLAHMFVLNFMWIPSLIIAGSLTVSLAADRRGLKKIRNIGGMVGALILFVLFNLFFITATLSRYTIFSSVVIWLLAAILLYHVIFPKMNEKLAWGITGIAALLILIQNFAYIDIFSNLIFNRVDSGKGMILDTNMDSTDYNDSLVNNYRYRYVDALLDRMLADAGYNEKMQIVQWRGADFTGKMWMIDLGWDIEKEKRVIAGGASPGTGIIPVNMVAVDELENGAALNGETILYFFPFQDFYGINEEEYITTLQQYYRIGERREVSNWGGTLSYYILTQ